MPPPPIPPPPWPPPPMPPPPPPIPPPPMPPPPMPWPWAGPHCTASSMMTAAQAAGRSQREVRAIAMVTSLGSVRAIESPWKKVERTEAVSQRLVRSAQANRLEFFAPAGALPSLATFPPGRRAYPTPAGERPGGPRRAVSASRFLPARVIGARRQSGPRRSTISR